MANIPKIIIDNIPNCLCDFLEDIGANNFIPDGEKASSIIWLNNPKNNPIAISILFTVSVPNKNKLIKNNGRNIKSNFLFRNKKLKRAIKIAMNK